MAVGVWNPLQCLKRKSKNVSAKIKNLTHESSKILFVVTCIIYNFKVHVVLLRSVLVLGKQ